MSAQQIIFFEKNKCDYSDTNVTFTASQGNTFASRVADRSNSTAWQTTGSVDADNTTLTIDMVDFKTITDIVLVKHNLKAFTIKYWNGSAYVDFSPAIAETNNTDTSATQFTVASVSTTKVQLTITGTQTANADKQVYQFLILNRIGQLAGWPIIDSPVFFKNRQKNTMLSGKMNVVQNVGGFQCMLKVANWNSSADLAIIETLFSTPDGFLVWLSGGNDSQFSSRRQGYRKEDFFLVNCPDDYKPTWAGGLYNTGMSIQVPLVEVTG